MKPEFRRHSIVIMWIVLAVAAFGSALTLRAGMVVLGLTLAVYVVFVAVVLGEAHNRRAQNKRRRRYFD